MQMHCNFLLKISGLYSNKISTFCRYGQHNPWCRWLYGNNISTLCRYITIMYITIYRLYSTIISTYVDQRLRNAFHSTTKKRALSSRRVLFLLLLRTYKTEFIHHRSHLVCKFAIQCPELGKFLRHVLFPQHLQLIVTAVPVVYLTVVKLIRTCHGT